MLGKFIFVGGGQPPTNPFAELQNELKIELSFVYERTEGVMQKLQSIIDSEGMNGIVTIKVKDYIKLNL